MRIALVLAVCAVSACAARTELDDLDFDPPVAHFVHSTAFGPTTGTSATIPIPATAEGNLLVVGMTYTGVDRVTITAAGHELRPWMESTLADCGLKSAEAYILPNAPQGATSIVVTKPLSATFDVFVLEFSGLGTQPLVDSLAGAPSPTPQAPALHAAGGQLVISTMTSCGTLTAIAPSSAFTAVDFKDSGSVAYLIPTDPGSYGAQWSSTGGISIANTLVFH